MVSPGEYTAVYRGTVGVTADPKNVGSCRGDEAGAPGWGWGWCSLWAGAVIVPGRV